MQVEQLLWSSGFSLLAALIAAFITHNLSMRADRTSKRRSQTVTFLISAYSDLEAVSNRVALSSEQKDQFERALSSIQLLGSKRSAKLANDVAAQMAMHSGAEIRPLLSLLRSELRTEIGLDASEIDLQFFRFER